MASLEDYAISMAVRDVVKRMVASEIQALRPAPRYAVVSSINYVNQRCSVVFNGETGAVQVNMGYIQPSRIGQVVRVEGVGTDKYIADVLDQPWVDAIASVDPAYTVGNPKIIFEGETDFDPRETIWDASYVPQAGDTVLATPLRGGKIQIREFTPTEIQPYPVFIPAALQNSWVDYDSVNWQVAGFTKTTEGVVVAQGLIKSGATIPGTLLFTLPVGFRPVERQMFGTVANDLAARIDVETNGDVILQNAPNGNGFVSLNGIIFPTVATGWTGATYQNSWMTASGWPSVKYRKDSFGTVWTSGVASRATAPTPEQAIFTYPTDMRPSLKLHRASYSTAGLGDNHVGIPGDFTWKAGSAGYSYFSACGNPFEVAGTLTWNNANYLNSWVSYNETLYPSAGWAVRPDGLVRLKGLIRGGAVNTTVFNLPEGARPGKRMMFLVTASNDVARVDVFADGNVQVRSVSTSPISWVGLDGITFVAQQ